MLSIKARDWRVKRDETETEPTRDASLVSAVQKNNLKSSQLEEKIQIFNLNSFVFAPHNERKMRSKF